MPVCPEKVTRRKKRKKTRMAIAKLFAFYAKAKIKKMGRLNTFMRAYSFNKNKIATSFIRFSFIYNLNKGDQNGTFRYLIFIMGRFMLLGQL